MISALATAAFLVACGGAPIETPPARISAVAFPEGAVPFAEGPINAACRSERRAQSSRARCGCIQAVANLTLSSGQQQRGTGYFGDPGRLQEVRQSDRSSDERFWGDWTRFADAAEQLCRAT